MLDATHVQSFEFYNDGDKTLCRGLYQDRRVGVGEV